MTSRRQALERNAAMAVAGEIARGRVALDGDGCLPLEALVAARARRTASARSVIAILQGWGWVRRVEPGRWTVGDGGADPHRAARADFPPDGKCAACTQDLTGAHTVAGGGRLVVCASCAGPLRSGVALDDLVAVVTTLLGARAADRASRLAHRLRARFPELAWEEIRRREVEERIRIGGEREEARRGPRLAGASWSAVEPVPDGEVAASARAGRRTGGSPGRGHVCRVCGRTRANEQFSGKGHAQHVCKECERTRRRLRREHRKAHPATEPP